MTVPFIAGYMAVPFISGFGVLVLVGLLCLLVGGLANPRTRPVVLGLAAIVGLGIFFSFFVRITAVQQQQSIARDAQCMWRDSTKTNMRRRWLRRRDRCRPCRRHRRGLPLPGAPTRPKMTLLVALRQAVLQAWMVHASTPVAEAPEKPAKKDHADESPRPQPPAWVTAASTMEDGCYTVCARAGPFTTELECERNRPKRFSLP